MSYVDAIGYRRWRGTDHEVIDNPKSMKLSDLPYWPAALRQEQAAAYCGLCVPTFTAVCPIKPIEFTRSSRGHRYLRIRLDAWLASLDKNDPETGSVRRRFGDMLGKPVEPIGRRRRRREQD